MPIKQLTDDTINKIAAGEVIERPVSVIKELVENALDAGAKKIDCTIDNTGGKNYMMVADDGSGMGQNDIPLALKRHTTSKLDEGDLLNINTFGFRGEALSSIATVAKLTVETSNANEAWIFNTANESFFPSSLPKGTTLKVEELFYKTPARLKFLKGDIQERNSIIDFIKRIALTHYDKSFSLHIDDKQSLNFPATNTIDSRIEQVVGKEFIDNSFEFSYKSEHVNLCGRASIPTYNFANSLNFFIYVNNRIVKDKLLINAVKIAFKNLIPSGRFPMIVLFLNVKPKLVDVNVHPAKIEVRFQNEYEIRETVINALRKGFHGNSRRTSSTLSTKAKEMLKWQAPEPVKQSTIDIPTPPPINSTNVIDKKPTSTTLNDNAKQDYGVESIESISSNLQQQIDIPAKQSMERAGVSNTNSIPENLDLGVAKCQINSTYIIAENKDGLVIVDQHAAHERLVLEEIKANVKQKSLGGQSLAIPEIIQLEETLVGQLMQYKTALEKLSFIIEKHGSNAVNIRMVPQIFGGLDIKALITDIAMNIGDYGIESIESEIEKIWGNIACYSSIRAGRKLRIEEMNAILRAIESTPNSAQCNHGRPTYLVISHKDIDKLFERL